MTDIFLAGGENPGHQQILTSCTVQRIAVNVTSLLRRSNLDRWSLDLPYGEWEWLAYCDGPAKVDDLALVIDKAAKPPQWVVGPPSWGDQDGYLPLWNGEGDMPGYRPKGMTVTDRVFKDKALLRRTLASRTSGTQLGAITGSTDAAIGRFDLVVSGSWWSSMKFGETQVWDGKKMHRYNADRKSEVRTRHLEHIEALGVDVDQVLLQDPDEVARLAIASWQAYGERLVGGIVVPMVPGYEEDEALEGSLEDDVASSPAIAMAAPPRRHGKTLLPVMGISSITTEEAQGDGTNALEEQAVVLSVDTSVRACDNCFLAASGCPGYQAGAQCAYSIPVEVKSKDQLQAVLSAMIEMQTQRVLQARFAEEVTGQELTPEFGRELDRLFDSVEKMRDIMDNRDMVKMTVEARGRSGVLSRLFGTQVGTNAKMLNTPVDSEDVMDAVLEEE